MMTDEPQDMAEASAVRQPGLNLGSHGTPIIYTAEQRQALQQMSGLPVPIPHRGTETLGQRLNFDLNELAE